MYFFGKPHYSHAQRSEWAMGKKLMSEGPKTKLAESQLLIRVNCHSIKMNSKKQDFPSVYKESLEI